MNLQINIPKPKYAMGNTVPIQNKEHGIITQEPELKQHELSISGRVETLIINYEYTVLVDEGSRGYKLYNYTETELDKYKEENKWN